MATLIVERHAYEAGAFRQQIQFPRDAFKDFFGSVGAALVDVYAAPHRNAPTRALVPGKVSRFQQSGTYRLSGVYELGNIGAVFVVIQQASAHGGVRRYSLWWELDLAFVAARYDGWQKGRDNQYGRGRVWTIVKSAVPRPISW